MDETLDVGLASRNGRGFQVRVFSGSSVLEAGEPTERLVEAGIVLSPLAMEEVGTIRGIALNVSNTQCRYL